MDPSKPCFADLTNVLIKEIIDLLPASTTQTARLVCRRMNEACLSKATILLEKREFQVMDRLVYSARPFGSHSRDFRFYFRYFGCTNVQKVLAIDGRWLLTFLVEHQILPSTVPSLFIGGCHLTKADIVSYTAHEAALPVTYCGVKMTSDTCRYPPSSKP